MSDLLSNFRKIHAVQNELRDEYFEDGEWLLWLTSWVCYPLFMLLALAFAAYCTFKKP